MGATALLARPSDRADRPRATDVPGVDAGGALRLNLAVLRQALVDARQRWEPRLAAEAVEWIATDGAELLDLLGATDLARLARAGVLHQIKPGQLRGD